MKMLYEEPLVRISMFDDEDDIVTVSGTGTNSAENQAVNAIKDNSGSSNVSLFSVDAVVTD